MGKQPFWGSVMERFGSMRFAISRLTLIVYRSSDWYGGWGGVFLG